MNVAEFLRSIQIVDLLVLLVVFSLFIVGYIQGTIRRLLGIASIVFSFLVAANLRDPLGGFFAANWSHLPTDYSYFVAFGVVFVIGVLGFSLIIQTLYTKVELFEKYPVIDEVLGGILGAVQAIVLVGAVVVILDSYFRLPGAEFTSPNELPFLRALWDALDPSGTAILFRDTLVPAFMAVSAPLLPEAVTRFYI